MVFTRRSRSASVASSGCDTEPPLFSCRQSTRPIPSSPMRGGRAVCIGLALSLLGARAHAVPFEDPAARTRVTQLDNGLTVLTLEDHSTPVVSLQLWARVGSGDEARFTGIAHLFEHMMFRGSAHLGKEEHSRLI